MVINLGELGEVGLSVLCFLVLVFIAVVGFKQNTKQHGGSGKDKDN